MNLNETNACTSVNSSQDATSNSANQHQRRSIESPNTLPNEQQSKFVMYESVFAKKPRDGNFYPATVKGIIEKFENSERFNYQCDFHIHTNTKTFHCELAESWLRKTSDLKSGEVVFVLAKDHQPHQPFLVKGQIVDLNLNSNTSGSSYNVEIEKQDGSVSIDCFSFREIIVPLF